MIHSDKLIVELTFQHKVKGYEHGFHIELYSSEATQLIRYLKSIGHWYSQSDPVGGVTLYPAHCQYIEKYILKRSILDYVQYEIVLGFIDSKDFSIYRIDDEDNSIVIAANAKRSNSLCHITLVTSYLARRIYDAGFNWTTGDVAISTSEFSKILKVSREIGSAPFEFNPKRYNFALRTISLKKLYVDSALQNGISQMELLN